MSSAILHQLLLNNSNMGCNSFCHKFLVEFLLLVCILQKECWSQTCAHKWMLNNQEIQFLNSCYLPVIRSLMLSAYMSACACSHSSLPARPCCLARYREMVFDWASICPSTSKTGTWPKGVPIKKVNHLRICWKTCNKYLLTSFECWPFSPLETNVLELNTCLIKNQTGQLSTTTEVEVMKFVSRHIGLQREFYKSLSLKLLVVKTTQLENCQRSQTADQTRTCICRMPDWNNTATVRIFI